MQKQQTPAGATPATDPGFKLPGDDASKSASAQGAAPVTAAASAPPPATATLEVASAPATVAADTANRDLTIGAAAFLILLVIFFFVRNAYVHHLVVRRVAPSTAGSAGWMMFVGFCFLSAAAVLALVNASKFLTFAVTGPLVAVGLVAMVATLLVGRR